MLDQLEDSPDLSDEEVAMAQAATEKDIPDHLRGITCCACDEPITRMKHELRRRRPYHYWRVRLHCAAGHESLRIFRMLDWRMSNGRLQRLP